MGFAYQGINKGNKIFACIQSAYLKTLLQIKLFYCPSIKIDFFYKILHNITAYKFHVA